MNEEITNLSIAQDWFDSMENQTHKGMIYTLLEAQQEVHQDQLKELRDMLHMEEKYIACTDPECCCCDEDKGWNIHVKACEPLSEKLNELIK